MSYVYVVLGREHHSDDFVQVFSKKEPAICCAQAFIRDNKSPNTVMDDPDYNELTHGMEQLGWVFYESFSNEYVDCAIVFEQELQDEFLDDDI